MRIYLWWLGEGRVDERMIEHARSHVQGQFDAPAVVERPADRPADALDPKRRQHSSTRILKWLSERRPADAERVLGITDVDLFIPILTFVFGEAQLGGAAAVVSMARLRAQEGGGGMFGGLLRDRARLEEARLAKECAHELGHTYGLLHCATASCVMSRSVSVIDVDAKSAGLCGDCQTRLGDLRRQGAKAHE